MIRNESTADRVIRVVIAIIAIVLIATTVPLKSVLGVILAIVAVLMLVTAASGFCPLYKIIGTGTAK